jgi:hypothetical protein
LRIVAACLLAALAAGDAQGDPRAADEKGVRADFCHP